MRLYLGERVIMHYECDTNPKWFPKLINIYDPFHPSNHNDDE
jgi:hypothetical protein